MDSRSAIAALLARHTALDKKTIEPLLQDPPSPELGDIAFPCFILAKSLRKSPADIASELAGKISPTEGITRIRAEGPYLNFFVDREQAAAAVLSTILKEKEKYGHKPKQKLTYAVEFFEANTHKAVHIGHIRNICFAEPLCRVFENEGIAVKRLNYQGDIGPHVAKCLWGYLHTKKKAPAKGRGIWLSTLYQYGHEQMKKSEKAVEESKDILQKIYAGDAKLVALWKKTRQWCLDDFEKLYADFGVRFDHYYFESEMEMPAREIAKKLVEKKVAKVDDSAIIIDMKKWDLGVFVLLTSDGRALYSSKDLALAQKKFARFKPDRSFHVVGKEQELHFRQVFKTLELMGEKKMAQNSEHISYGLVMLPEGKMSSREGTVVLYEDLKEKLVKGALSEVSKRHADWPKKKIDSIAADIAFAALKFGMLNRDNNKTITFDWKAALDFEGETGPYVLYANARINSIFRKYKKKALPAKVDYSVLSSTEEQTLLKMLADYPSVLSAAAAQRKPMLVSRFALELAQTFSNFYHSHPILSEADDIKNARLHLAKAVQQVLQNSLKVLAISAPQEM